MKLIIQIPCLNEEQTLPLVLKELPRKVAGFSSIEVVVIDDGSRDRTAEVARRHSCTVLRHTTNRGLGNAFRTGAEYALERGADVLVNTDADNQYPSRYIPGLVKPILDGRADIVIGDRRPWQVKHFGILKRFLQWFGSGVVRRMTGTRVPDTVSGFRAYNREALLRLNVTTKFSYVLDTIVQAGQKNLKLLSMPITTNAPTRHSRLFSNMLEHILRSGGNLLRVYAIYEPFRTFFALSILFGVPGIALGARFVYFFFSGEGGGHIQSLIATTILILTAVVMFALGIIGELLRTNRLIAEEQFYFLKKHTLGRKR